MGTNEKTAMELQCERADAQFDRVFKPIIAALRTKIADEKRQKKAETLLKKWSRR